MRDQLYNITYVQSSGQKGLFDGLINNNDLVFDILETLNPLPVSVRESPIGGDTFEPRYLLTTTKLPVIGIEWTFVPNHFQNTNGDVPHVRHISTGLTFDASISKNIEGVALSISGDMFTIAVGAFSRSYTVENIDQFQNDIVVSDIDETIKGPLLEVIDPLATAAKFALQSSGMVDDWVEGKLEELQTGEVHLDDATQLAFVDLTDDRASLGTSDPAYIPGIDNVSGTQFGDTVIGNDGANTLFGRNGSDTIEGGAGDDQIDGGADGDTIDGGVGADIIEGGSGTDQLRGGADGDLIFADSYGGSDSSDSELWGGDGDDILVADAGGNTLHGDAGNDILLGGAGNDILEGGDEADYIVTGGGTDEVRGGAGDDWINVTAGSKTTIYFDANSGNDYIEGFDDSTTTVNQGVTKIVFEGLSGDDVELIWDYHVVGTSSTNGMSLSEFESIISSGELPVDSESYIWELTNDPITYLEIVEGPAYIRVKSTGATINIGNVEGHVGRSIVIDIATYGGYENYDLNVVNPVWAKVSKDLELIFDDGDVVGAANNWKSSIMDRDYATDGGYYADGP